MCHDGERAPRPPCPADLEALLREAESRFRRLVDLVPAAIYTCEAPSGVITFFNDQAARLWGRAPAIGATEDRFCGSHRLWYPDGRPLAHDQTPMALALREGRSFRNVDVVIERPDGSRASVVVNIDPIRNGSGNITGAINTFHETTAQRAAEQALRESEQRLRDIIDAIPAAIYTTDAEGRLMHFNQEAVRFSGRVPELGTDQWCVSWKLYRTDGTPLPHDQCPMAVALREGRPIRGAEAIAERPDGTRLWFQPFPTPLRDAQGRVVGGINMLLDITERKAAERERSLLLASEQQARQEAELLADTARILTAGLDLQQTLQKTTDLGTQLSGARFGAFFYNAVDEKGESYALYTLSGAPREAFAKFGMPRNTPLFDHIFRGVGPMRLDDVLKDPRYGRVAPHHGMPKGHLPVRSYLAVPVTSGSGEVLGGLFFGHEEAGVFTERAERLVIGLAAQAAVAIDNARLYRAAQESEEQFRTLVSILTDVPWTTDPQGAFVSRQPAWEAYTGQLWEEHRGLGWAEAVHPEDRPGLLAVWEKARDAGTAYQADGRLWHAPTRGYRRFEVRAVPLRRADGSIRQWVGTCTDVHERCCAEEALQRSLAEERQAAEELARFNRAAVGRELRMVELKREINELCGAMGRPPRYRLEFDGAAPRAELRDGAAPPRAAKVVHTPRSSGESG